VILERIVNTAAFASVTNHEQLARLYVPSGQLAGLQGNDRPEAQLMNALRDPAGQRVQIIGPSGAGKTGMILKVLGHLAGIDPHREVLLVNVGDDTEQLSSSGAFMRMLVKLVELQGHRFASVDPEVLRNAAADELTETDPQVSHQGGANAVVVSYTATLQEAYKTYSFGDSAPRAREDLESVLGLVAEEHRPLILIDDTERFVAPGSGEIDEASVSNLYHHCVRSLAEIGDVDLVIAVHPAYRDIAVVDEVAERYRFVDIHVAELPASSDDPAIRAILQRRLDRAGIDGAVDDVVEPAALAQLTSLYFLNGHDLREVLNLAHDAARAASAAPADRIAIRHVQPLLDARIA